MTRATTYSLSPRERVGVRGSLWSSPRLALRHSGADRDRHDWRSVGATCIRRSFAIAQDDTCHNHCGRVLLVLDQTDCDRRLRCPFPVRSAGPCALPPIGVPAHNHLLYPHPDPSATTQGRATGRQGTGPCTTCRNQFGGALVLDQTGFDTCHPGASSLCHPERPYPAILSPHPVILSPHPVILSPHPVILSAAKDLLLQVDASPHTQHGDTYHVPALTLTPSQRERRVEAAP